MVYARLFYTFCRTARIQLSARHAVNPQPLPTKGKLNMDVKILSAKRIPKP